MGIRVNKFGEGASISDDVVGYADKSLHLPNTERAIHASVDGEALRQ